MNINLCINTGFLVNRYPDHHEWISLVSDKLNIDNVQLTADMLNPSLPDDIFYRDADKILKITKKNKIKIQSTFTGAFTRVNHLAHPDKKIRKYWIQWFKKFINLTSILESESMGSHFGILSFSDSTNAKKMNIRKKQNIDGWMEISDYAKTKGLKFLSWEPMSIKREYGETIKSCKKLHKEINENSSLPFRICLDVDHGDISSKNKNDYDPYVWLKNFAKETSYIHLKQSMKNKSNHFPFTRKNNKLGNIQPKKILKILNECNISNMDLILELSFKERDPYDKNSIKDVKESINFWKKNLTNLI